MTNKQMAVQVANNAGFTVAAVGQGRHDWAVKSYLKMTKSELAYQLKRHEELKG